MIRIILLLAITWLTACSDNTPQQPLRIGINPWPGYEYFYLAQQTGIFARNGAKVELVELSSLADTRNAFESGKIDAMLSTMIEVIQAKQIGNKNPLIPLIVDYSNGPDEILGTDAVATIDDIRGKRVGFESGSLGAFMLHRALELHGMTISDVLTRSLDQPSMRKALQDGSVDVVVTYPPTSTLLRQQMQMHTLFSSADISGEVVDVFAIDAEVLPQHGATVQAIVNSWSETLIYAAANPEQANAIMAKREGLTAAEFAEALQGLVLPTLAQQRELLVANGKITATLQSLATMMHNAGLVPAMDAAASQSLLSDKWVVAAQ